MTEQTLTLAPFFKDWETYNTRIVEAVRSLTTEQLAHRAFPGYMPIWGITAHLAGARGYWLCGILGEPGETLAPLFPDPASGVGWEDAEDHPRSAEELAWALEATWKIVEGCLGRWTPETMNEEFSRGEWEARTHTRQSVIMRLLSHDAYHGGEISIGLGQQGLPAINFW